jgi:hypothetical protein
MERDPLASLPGGIARAFMVSNVCATRKSAASRARAVLRVQTPLRSQTYRVSL